MRGIDTFNFRDSRCKHPALGHIECLFYDSRLLRECAETVESPVIPHFPVAHRDRGRPVCERPCPPSGHPGHLVNRPEGRAARDSQADKTPVLAAPDGIAAYYLVSK